MLWALLFVSNAQLWKKLQFYRLKQVPPLIISPFLKMVVRPFSAKTCSWDSFICLLSFIKYHFLPFFLSFFLLSLFLSFFLFFFFSCYFWRWLRKWNTRTSVTKNWFEFSVWNKVTTKKSCQILLFVWPQQFNFWHVCSKSTYIAVTVWIFVSLIYVTEYAIVQKLVKYYWIDLNVIESAPT